MAIRLVLVLTNACSPVFRAQAIDYDELRCGHRRSALFTMVDSLVETVFGIFSSVIPPLILNYLGYHNNSGCDCGCGVACKKSFLRWSCSGDIGYACSQSFEATLFYGPRHRPAPCTYQNPMVIVALSGFMFLAPFSFYTVAAIRIHSFPITKAVRRVSHRCETLC